MRTTLDLPEALLKEAMTVTRVRTKTGVIRIALANLIQREKIRDLKNYRGKLDLNIDLDKLRDR